MRLVYGSVANGPRRFYVDVGAFDHCFEVTRQAEADISSDEDGGHAWATGPAFGWCVRECARATVAYRAMMGTQEARFPLRGAFLRYHGAASVTAGREWQLDPHV